MPGKFDTITKLSSTLLPPARLLSCLEGQVSSLRYWVRTAGGGGGDTIQVVPYICQVYRPPAVHCAVHVHTPAQPHVLSVEKRLIDED